MAAIKPANIKLSEEISLLNKKVAHLEKQLTMILDERNNKEKIAYLTFDDGPSINTVKILDILNEHGISATFFVNGHEDEFADSVYRRIVQENHTLANHSYSHEYDKIYHNEDSFFEDFYQLEELLSKYNAEKQNIVRLPGGSNNTMVNRYGGEKEMTKILSKLSDEGYTYVDWNVDSMDASHSLVNKNAIVNNVLKQSEGKTKVNVLMHDSSAKTTTAEALPEIIIGLREQGFRFAKISDLSPIVQFKSTN